MSPENGIQDKFGAYDAAARAHTLEYHPFTDRPAHKGYPGKVVVGARHMSRIIRRGSQEIYAWMHPERQFHGGCC